ncbi:DUF5703 family protein [Nocardia spumae]|uniref:DUF5703 family protein n=1 Tax=Nocardia spumae TaxID=2887190 RepID=UPI001D14ED94|nr:DUF5703 family protein [Nocardia spumae]
MARTPRYESAAGAAHRAQRRRSLPSEWEETSDEGEYEYVPLRLPPDVNRVTASMRLAIQAEFGGWELSRVRAYTDGSRRVLLRRRKTSFPVTETGM